MSDASLATMLVVLSLVWGGFAALLLYALRQERNKSANGQPPGEGEG